MDEKLTSQERRTFTENVVSTAGVNKLCKSGVTFLGRGQGPSLSCAEPFEAILHIALGTRELTDRHWDLLFLTA